MNLSNEEKVLLNNYRARKERCKQYDVVDAETLLNKPRPSGKVLFILKTWYDDISAYTAGEWEDLDYMLERPELAQYQMDTALKSLKVLRDGGRLEGKLNNANPQPGSK